MSTAPRSTTPQHAAAAASALAADQLAALAAGFSLIPSYSRTDRKFRKVPIEGWQQRVYTARDFKREHGVILRLGPQSNGLYLYCIDLDSHGPTQSASRSRGLMRWNLNNDALADRLSEYKSTWGTGLHLFLWSPIEISSGTLYDNQDHKIGEFLTSHVVFPDAYRKVTHALEDAPKLTADDVQAILAALNYRETINTAVVAADLQLGDNLVQHWYRNYQALEDERGVPRGIGNGPSYKVLAGLAPITNASDARWMVMHQMHRVGYTDAQIIGYVMRRCAWNRDGNHLAEDCTRILIKLNAEVSERHISRVAMERDQVALHQQAINVPDEFLSPRKRPRGRPKGGAAERLLAHFTKDGSYGTFTDTNAVFMADLHCSERSIQRALDVLEKRGEIKRETVNGQRLIILTPDQKGDKKSDAVIEPEIVEIAPQDAAEALLCIADEAGTIDGTTCSPLPPAVTCQEVSVQPASISIVSAIQAAIEAVAIEQCVTKQRVQAAYATYFAGMPWSDRIYQRLLAERQRNTRDARLHQWARDALPAELRRKARNLAYRQQQAIEQGHHAQAYAIGLQARIIEDEIEVRCARSEMKQRRSPRTPKQRSIVAEVAKNWPESGMQQGAGSTPASESGAESAAGGVCIGCEQTVATIKKEPVYDGRGLVARLRALKAQREAAQGVSAT